VRHRIAGIALAAALALIFSTSAGGGKTAVRHLRVGIADFVATPTQLAFANNVRRLSHGSLVIELAPKYAGDIVDKDRRVADALRAGDLEMAWLPTRVWELEGVSTFRALQAPFLITGYRLLGKVITGPVGRSMLAGTSRIGIRTLALTAVDLRRLLGVKRPFVALADFRGARISVAAGAETSEAAIAALGATPVNVGGGDLLARAMRDGEVDGAETAWEFILANGYYAFARYVTGNVVLFARADASAFARAPSGR
jgi:TRAP-type transport system periplasmic protein